MNIGVLGLGMVGQTIASKLVEVGHHVAVIGQGIRGACEMERAWKFNHRFLLRSCDTREILFNATSGTGALET